jgi:hypothetical protein
MAIFKNIVSGKTFYHLLFKLTPTNSTLTVPSGYKNPIYRTEDVSSFDPSGFFEIYIRASDFPLPSPGCEGGWIILRMRSTNSAERDSRSKIDAKKALWQSLQAMYESEKGSVEVVIELNPYVRVINPVIPKLELEYCNVFFRQAFGAYVPYVGPLK